MPASAEEVARAAVPDRSGIIGRLVVEDRRRWRWGRRLLVNHLGRRRGCGAVMLDNPAPDHVMDDAMVDDRAAAGASRLGVGWRGRDGQAGGQGGGERRA